MDPMTKTMLMDDCSTPLNSALTPTARTSLKEKIVGFLKKNLLLVLTTVGVLLGIAVGFAVRTTMPSEDALMWLGLPGQLYLRMLKMMIVPLIISSVITGTASLDPRVNGKISIVAFVFIFVTNSIGAVMGVSASLIFKPGSSATGYEQRSATEPMESQDIFADLLRNVFPANLFQDTFSQTQTQYDRVPHNVTNGSVVTTVMHVEKTIGRTGGANLIGLIVASTLLGIAAASVKERGHAFIQFFSSTTDIVIAVIRWLMWATPVGVISLIAVAIASIENIAAVFSDLGMFVLAVVITLIIQQLLVMPLIYFVIVRKNPYAFLLSISKPWLISLAASSTAVALPEMLYVCEVDNGLDQRVARFVLPFSVTLSANGSAVFISVSCIFIANLTGTVIGAGDILLIGLLSAVSSLAIPSVPSASIVTIIMILSSFNMSAEAVALLLATEWCLDRLRTTSSTVSHTMCAAATDRICRRDLRKADKEAKEDGEALHGNHELVNVTVQDGRSRSLQ